MVRRVMQVITHLGVGGAEHVALSLIRGLSTTYAFSVFLPCGIDDGPVAAGMERDLDELGVAHRAGTRVPIKRGGLAIAAWRLTRAVAELRPNLLHLHTEIPEATYAAAVAFAPALRRIPAVRTIHNSVYWVPQRRIGAWCARTLRDADVAAVSRAALQAYDQLRVEARCPPPPAPPWIIPNGIEPVRVKEPAATSDVIRMLFAGRLEEQKGADLLPAIVRATRLPAGKRVQLDVLGEGSFGESLRDLATRPPPGWSITVGRPRPNLAAHLADFDLVVMPSRFEGLSILAMEALTAAVPVVATDAPGLREGFPDDYPWLARHGNATAFAELLATVVAHPATWPTVAQSGRRFAIARFSATSMCDAYAELYERALARGSRR